MNNQPLLNNEDVPMLTVIQQIKEGILNPKILTKELRQQCVEVFLAEGYTIPSMAKILKRNEKTIRRDIDEIRERNALSPDINFSKNIIGEMVTGVRINRNHLMRLARTSGASVAEKCQSEYQAALVLFQMIGKLQSLGYLPCRAQTVIGDISCREYKELSYSDMNKMVVDIENDAKQSDCLSPEYEEEINKLKLQIGKAEIKEKIDNLTNKNTDEDKYPE